MPRGASPQREKEYEELVDEFHSSHRYLGREEEVASRIVNKQRAQHGETMDEIEADKHGESPDRNLPIANFDRLDIDQVVAKLDGLHRDELRVIKKYERAHNDRSSLIEELDRRLNRS